MGESVNTQATRYFQSHRLCWVCPPWFGENRLDIRHRGRLGCISYHPCDSASRHLLLKVQQVDRVWKPFALRTLRHHHRSCQFLTCVGRFEIHVRSNYVTVVYCWTSPGVYQQKLYQVSFCNMPLTPGTLVVRTLGKLYTRYLRCIAFSPPACIPVYEVTIMSVSIVG